MVQGSFSQTKYHIPRWKTVSGSLKQKNYQCYVRKNLKMTIKNVKMKIPKNKKQKKFFFFSYSKDPVTRKFGS